ncbi:hypothetical protein Celaphus_00014169, partial [Cervus elaphus hippelaphus]
MSSVYQENKQGMTGYFHHQHASKGYNLETNQNSNVFMKKKCERAIPFPTGPGQNHRRLLLLLRTCLASSFVFKIQEFLKDIVIDLYV